MRARHTAIAWLLCCAALPALGPHGASADDKAPTDAGAAAQLLNASQDVSRGDPMLGLLLAREAFEREPSESTRTGLYDRLVETYERAVFRGHQAPLTCVDLSDDAQLVLTGSEDGTARIWTRAGEAVRTHDVGRPVLAATFLQGARALTVSGTEQEGRVDLRLWTKDGAIPLGAGLAPDAYAVSPARNRVLVSSGSAAWVLWGADGTRLHDFEASSASFGPRGRCILVRQPDGPAVLHDADGGNPVRFEGTTASSRILLDATGSRVLSYAPDGPAVLYDARGKALASFAPEHPVEAACFSPKDGTLVTASGSAFHVWSPAGRELTTFPKAGRATCMAFEPGGHVLLTLTGAVDLTIWGVPAWEAYSRCRLKKPASWVEVMTGGHWNTVRYEDGSLGFHDFDLQEANPIGTDGETSRYTRMDPRERWNLNAAPNGDVSILAFDNRRYSLWLFGHRDVVVDACFAPGEDLVVTASRDGTARLWDLGPGGTPVLGGHEHEVWGGAFGGGERGLVTNAWSTSFFWEREGRPRGRRVHDEIPAWWSFCATTIAIVLKDSRVATLYGYDGTEIATVKHDDVVSGVAFLPDGSRLLLWSQAGRSVSTHDLKKGKPIGTIRQDGAVLQATFGKTKDRVATLGPANRVRVWSDRGKQKAEWSLPEAAGSLSAVQDGKILATLAKDGSVVRFWDEKGKALLAIRGHDKPIVSFDFTPKGNHVVTASKDHTARVWGMDGKEILSLPHPHEVVDASFFRDDTLIGTACEDGALRIWDLDGKLLAVLRGHKQGLVGWHVHESGDLAVTFSKDFTARLWPLGDDRLREVARMRSSRDFTPGEREKYAGLLAR